MSGPKYLLDTNILIGFLGGAKWATDFLARGVSENADLLVSTITRMELLAFPGILEEEQNQIIKLLSQLQRMPIDEQVEEAAILIRRQTKLKLPDAIIAATAQIADAVLVTADDDFVGLRTLQVYNPR